MSIDLEKEELAATLKGSLLEFTKTFYPLLTGRDFIVSCPPGREPHVITICRALSQCARLEIPDQRLIINVPPGHGKSTLLSMWIAWCLASYPDSRYLYISYSKVLAAKHTETIKRIVSLAHYRYLFDIQIRHDSKAKDSWQTTHGGSVSAHGSSGSITGFDAGLPGLDRHSGALVMDDMHKADEVHSDTIRQSVIDNYNETIMQRCRGINVPMIFIGQRLHEDDLPAYMLNGNDGHHWQSVILKSIDEAGNALYPEAFPLSMLRIREERDIYVFASQHQQDPQPAGGALFKPEWFTLLDFEPQILQTFITADTAETDKSYNDATVFSFWGVYEIETMGRKTGEYGLHWIDCAELRIEPKDLRDAFLDFWQDCMIHKVPPLLAAIEKKSTGVTLLSVIKEMRGIQVRDIERNRSSGSKTARFLQCQPHVAARKISFTAGARHVDMCIKHMSKITANDTHRHDDVCYVSGSRIATTRGYVNIEDITLSDKIITPFGIGSVTACGSTGFRKVIKNIGLEGTPNHPVLYGSDFIPLMTAIDMVKLSKLSFIELLKWKQRQLLYLMERNSDCRHRQDILKLLKENIETNFFIALYGSFIQKKKYLRAIWFTTRTIINMIIVLKIWSVFQLRNIARFILKDVLKLKNVKSFLLKCALIPKNIINRKKEKPSSGLLQPSLLRRLSQLSVRFAQKSLSVFGIIPIFAPQNASANGAISGIEKDMQTDLCLQESAHIAKMNTKQKAFHPQSTIAKHVREYAQDDTDMKEVFNLAVEPYGVYYANGILVSNCDTAADAIKMALIDKTLIHTTLNKTDYNQIARSLTHQHNKIGKLRDSAYKR